MATKDLLNYVEGLYTDTSLLMIPENALYIQDNCVTSYKLGAILKRPGYTKIGSALQANKSILGLHNFRQSASVQKMLATVNNSGDTATQLFYSTGGAWTSVGAAASAWTIAGANVEMEDFIGYCFFVGYNGTSFLPVGSLTGTTFSTSTNVTNMPQAKYIVRYRDRLYVANCYITATAYPYRVYFSSIPSAGTISWTQATDFFDVDYSEEIKGLATNWDRLLVFTEYSAYYYDQNSKFKVFDVGTSNHRTIKNFGQYMIWADMNNVWASTGGQPQAVGGRVIDFIRNANMTNAFAEVVAGEYHLYLGSVTVNGITYSNCTLVFDIISGTWRVHEYYNTMTMFGKFYSSGQDYLYMGTSLGTVMKLGKYTDATLLVQDDVYPIHSWFQTGALSFDSPKDEKQLDRLVVYTDRAQGLKFKMRIVDKNVMALSKFMPIGECKQYINDMDLSGTKGNFIQIEAVESGSNPYWSFLGMTAIYSIAKVVGGGGYSSPPQVQMIQ